jgi:hypothetical protein
MENSTVSQSEIGRGTAIEPIPRAEFFGPDSFTAPLLLQSSGKGHPYKLVFLAKLHEKDLRSAPGRGLSPPDLGPGNCTGPPTIRRDLL